MGQNVKMKARMGEVFNETPSVFLFGQLADDPDRVSIMGMSRQSDIACLSDPHFVNCVLILLTISGSASWRWS